MLPRVIIETQGEFLLRVLQGGTVSTNVYLRRLHNFCLDMNWLPWPLIPKRQWPAVRYKDKRAITYEEHCRIVAREQNPQRKAFYQMAWHLGASQSDLAHLQAEDVDYRLAAGLTERLRLAENIFALILPDLRVFVFSGLPPQVAEDALQEVLKAVATGMSRFAGNTTKEFWSWCYRIARNKLADQYRRQSSERTVSMSPDELWKVLEASAQAAPLTPQNRLDLEHAMKLLTAAKPDCSDLLWRHYVVSLDYAEIAAEKDLNSDAFRMRVKRCLDEAKALVA